jgi:ElaA protein
VTARTTFLPHEVATYARFEALAPIDVHDLLALRQEIFVVEQKCLYVDADGRDPEAEHLLVRDGRTSALLAVLRVLAPGTRFPERSIGRVAVRASARGTGLGRAIMAEAVRRIDAAHGQAPIRLAAQAHLERFYASLGFERASDEFDEDGIPHVEMLRAGSAG